MTTIADDRFSYQRVMALMRLMWPRLRNTSIVYLAVGAVTMALILLLTRFSFILGLLPFLVFIPAILYYISPVFVTSTMTASQAALLPATPGEKLLAVCAYSIVILPAAAYLLPQIASFIVVFNSEQLCSLGISAQSIYFKNPIWLLMNYLSGCLPLLVCLYSALSNPGKKWRPALMGLLTVLLIGLAGGLYGGIEAMRIGFEDGMNGVMPDELRGQELSLRIINDVLSFVPFIIFVSLGLCALCLWLCYRRIANRQL